MSMLTILLAKGSLLASAMLILISMPAKSEDGVEGLGRLFIDAEQREKLESVRRGTYKAEVEQESRVSNIRIDGIMLRSDGENVIWINGESALHGTPIEGVNINPKSANGDTYNVQLSIDGKRISLKPGQNWSEGTGTIKDGY